MKTTIVPAQVTTVEDKITGNLGVSQMLLLVVPVFVGSLLFVLLPPFYEYAMYKIVLLVILSTVCISLSIRIRGKIVLFWIAVMLHYNVRPRYYVYDKNDLHLRELAYAEEGLFDTEVAADTTEMVTSPRIAISDAVSVENLILNPESNFRLSVNKKGRLSVHLTEI